MRTIDAPIIESNKNRHITSNEDINPYWPTAQVLPSAINSKSEVSKSAYKGFLELGNALKKKFIHNEVDSK